MKTIKEKLRDKLQLEYIKKTGKDVVDSNAYVMWDYAEWLEDKLIKLSK